MRWGVLNISMSESPGGPLRGGLLGPAPTFFFFYSVFLKFVLTTVCNQFPGEADIPGKGTPIALQCILFLGSYYL